MTDRQTRRAREAAFWAERPSVRAIDLSEEDLEVWYRIQDGRCDPVLRARVEAAGEALLSEIDRWERTPDPQIEDFPLIRQANDTLRVGMTRGQQVAARGGL